MSTFDKKKIREVKFGVPFFDVFDPRFANLGVPIAVRGCISFKIKNRKKFLKQYGKDESIEAVQIRLRNAIVRYVKECTGEMIEKYGLPVMQLERKLGKISDVLQFKLKAKLKQDFFISLTAVDVTAIEVDKTSEGYKQLKKVTEDVEIATLQAQAELSIQKMQEEQRIEMENCTIKVKERRKKIKIRRVVYGVIVGVAVAVVITTLIIVF